MKILNRPPAPVMKSRRPGKSWPPCPPANAMTIHEFLIPPAEIAKRDGPHNKIVMSSRVRLARNVKGLAFPGWAKKAERLRILDSIRPAVEALPQMSDCFTETMD